SGNGPRGAGQLVGINERCLFFDGKSRYGSAVQSLPVVGAQAYSLRRSEMMLQSIVTLVNRRDPDVDHLVELAIQRSSHAGVKRHKSFQSIQAMRHGLVDIA